MMETDEKDTASPKADFWWLWAFIDQHRRDTILTTLAGIVAGIASAAEPYLIGIIIDHVREGAPLSQLMQDGLLIVALAGIAVFGFFWMRYYSGKVSFTVVYDIRQTLFQNMLTLEQGFFHRYPTGDIISRMHGDVEMITRLLMMGLSRIGSAIFVLLATFVLLASVNLPLAVIVFVILSVSTAFQLKAGTVLSPMFENVQDQGGIMSSLVQDSVSGIQTIKTTGTEAFVAQKYHEENAEFRRRWLYFRRRYEPVGMLPNMISELTAGIVVLGGGYMTVQGTLTIGNFVQFLIYLNVIANALLQIGTIAQRYQQTDGALRRLTPILQVPKIRDAANPLPMEHPQGEIEYRDVGVKIGDDWLLKDISFKVESGKTIAFVGPTGCGKTLLVNLLMRVLDPTEGTVFIDDIDVRQIKLDDLRQVTAYVPQSTFLFSQELHQNVRMGKTDISDEEIDNAIRISRVSNDLNQLPHGLNTMVGEKGVMLSGGQKQRVAIARAVIRDSAVLVLDDALSSVDTHTSAEILAELRDVLGTRTSIIIAHRIATVKDADVIYVMENGRIVEQGTHEQLIAQHGAYTRMVEREIKQEDSLYA